MDKTKVIVVAGPTASGKTTLAVEIAKAVGGEVISADSMQVYKGMEIASAAPTEQEMAGIEHHMVQFLERDVPFSAADFCNIARGIISDIVSRGKVPVIAGGTGLFIDSLIDNVNFIETKNDPDLRERLMAQSEDELHAELEKQILRPPERYIKTTKTSCPRA